jgi:hypothetical protein
MRIIKLCSLIIACCLLATILTGCASAPDARIEPQTILKFTDIPIPVGLKPLAMASYSFESAGVRVAVLKYLGRGNLDQVINFYKEQMPMYNWNLINIVEYGQRLLNFERENETCIITMQTSGWWNENILVTISVGPKSQYSSKKAKTPVK